MHEEGSIMTFPLSIKFHNTRKSARMEEEIRDFAARLDKYHQRIQSCEVVIDQPHTQHQKGNDFQVRILISLPRKQQVAVTSSTPKHGDHTSLRNTVRDAFDVAARQLKAFREKPITRRVKTARKPLDVATQAAVSAGI
jgi:ribosome-associated translation inhibitor RaiA